MRNSLLVPSLVHVRGRIYHLILFHGVFDLFNGFILTQIFQED